MPTMRTVPEARGDDDTCLTLNSHSVSQDWMSHKVSLDERGSIKTLQGVAHYSATKKQTSGEITKSLWARRGVVHVCTQG
jgi:hypothetical protein